MQDLCDLSVQYIYINKFKQNNCMAEVYNNKDLSRFHTDMPGGMIKIYDQPIPTKNLRLQV